MTMSRWVLPLATAAALIFGAGTSAASAPRAHAAGSCNVGSGTGYGYSYLTSLTVRNTSCGTGKHLAKKHGNVSGWSCHKKRLDTSPVQYDDRETCTSGSAKVVWTFTQNT
jgi:hypothetical protein